MAEPITFSKNVCTSLPKIIQASKGIMYQIIILENKHNSF